MFFKRSLRDSTVYSAVMALDVVLLDESLCSQGEETKGALKEGEVAFNGLKKSRLMIFDPKHPRHCIVCRNVMSYPEKNHEVVYMSQDSYLYFRKLGFKPLDTVYIREA